MREWQEMVTASRMQHLVQIRKKNDICLTNIFFCIFNFRALGVESPRLGAIMEVFCTVEVDKHFYRVY